MTDEIRINALQQSIDNRTVRLNEIQSKCDNCQGAMDGLDATIALNPDNVADLIDARTKHCMRRDKLSGKVNSLNNLIAELNAEIDALTP